MFGEHNDKWTMKDMLLLARPVGNWSLTDEEHISDLRWRAVGGCQVTRQCCHGDIMCIGARAAGALPGYHDLKHEGLARGGGKGKRKRLSGPRWADDVEWCSLKLVMFTPMRQVDEKVAERMHGTGAGQLDNVPLLLNSREPMEYPQYARRMLRASHGGDPPPLSTVVSMLMRSN